MCRRSWFYRSPLEYLPKGSFISMACKKFVFNGHNNLLCVLQSLLASHSDLAINDKAFWEERFLQGAAWLLHNFNVVQMVRSFKSQNSIDSQLWEVLFVNSEEFGAEGGSSNVQEILSELFIVIRVVEGYQWYVISSRNLFINKNYKFR